MADTVEVEQAIAADPQLVWAMVSDVPRMGEWSPEAEGGAWRGEATGPAVGAVFAGRNRRGWRRWGTTCTVRACEPGRAFGFDVDSVGLAVARWDYLFEPTDDGCIVRERWTDRRGRLMTWLGTVATGVRDRAGHNRAGMEETLRRLAEAAESA